MVKIREGSRQKQARISATILGAISNKSLDHVFRICVLELLLNGILKVTQRSNGIKIRAVFPALQSYEKAVTRHFEGGRSPNEPIKKEITGEFRSSLIDFLKRSNLAEQSRIFKRLKPTTRAKEMLKAEGASLSGAVEPPDGFSLNQTNLKLIALHPKEIDLLFPAYQFVNRIRFQVATEKDWFYATAWEKDRFEAMMTGVNYYYSDFD